MRNQARPSICQRELDWMERVAAGFALLVLLCLSCASLFAQPVALPTRSVSASDSIGALGIRSFSKVHQGTPTNRSLFEQRASLVDLDLDVERSGFTEVKIAAASAAGVSGSFLSGESATNSGVGVDVHAGKAPPRVRSGAVSLAAQNLEQSPQSAEMPTHQMGRVVTSGPSTYHFSIAAFAIASAGESDLALFAIFVGALCIVGYKFLMVFGSYDENEWRR